MKKALSAVSRQRIAALAGKYPRPKAALLPALRIIQEELGRVSPEAEREAAEILGLRPIEVRETVTFYSLLRRQPLGRHHLQVCDNLSCGLRGSGALISRLQELLGIGPGETTADGRFTLSTVSCLGGCDEAPCLMIDFEHYGRVDLDKVERLIRELD